MPAREERTLTFWDRPFLHLRGWIWVMIAAMVPVAFAALFEGLSPLWTDALLVGIAAGSMGGTVLRRRA